jgi:hypothetical protein
MVRFLVKRAVGGRGVGVCAPLRRLRAGVLHARRGEGARYRAVTPSGMPLPTLSPKRGVGAWRVRSVERPGRTATPVPYVLLVRAHCRPN